LALAPLLAGMVWLARVPLERGIASLLGRLGSSNITVPALSLQNAGIAAAAVVGAGLLAAAGGAVYCWQTYLRD
jgi:hypothetical protein